MSGRPWMPMYWGDYLQDTAHFTLAEHGAYILLIAFYWTNGKLPEDEEAIRRVAKATTHQWKKMRPVLVEKFSTEWKHKRIDSEIAKSLEKSQTKSANAKRQHCERRANALQTHTQSQPQSQEEEKIVGDASLRSAALPVPRETKKRANARAPLPDSWAPTDADVAYAVSRGFTRDQSEELGRNFKNHHIAAGNLMADWHRAFCKWCDNEIKWRKPSGFGGSRPVQDDSRSISRAAGRLAEQADRGQFTFGPRPQLVPAENPNPVRLLPKG